ncbi:MAG TPA: hypothetical protein VF719_04540, partial [Abditibacteriaceae bacterium]
MTIRRSEKKGILTTAALHPRFFQHASARWVKPAVSFAFLFCCLSSTTAAKADDDALKAIESPTALRSEVGTALPENIPGLKAPALETPTAIGVESAPVTTANVKGEVLTIQAAGSDAVEISVVDEKVKVNGEDPAGGEVDASSVTNIQIASGAEANRITVSWTPEVNALTIVSDVENNDTLEIKGALAVNGTLDVRAAIVKATGLTRGPTGRIQLQDASGPIEFEPAVALLQATETNTLSKPSAKPVADAYKKSDDDGLAKLTAAVADATSLELVPVTKLDTKTPPTRLVLPKDEKTAPKTENVTASPSRGAVVISSLDNQILTLKVSGAGAVDVRVVDGKVQLNNADPSFGELALADLRGIVLVSGPEANRLDISLTGTVDELVVTADENSNDTLNFKGVFVVTQELKISAPHIRVAGILSAARVDIRSFERTLVATNAVVTSAGGEIVIHGGSGQVLLQPGSRLDVSGDAGPAGKVRVGAAHIGAAGEILARGGGNVLLQAGAGGFCF